MTSGTTATYDALGRMVETVSGSTTAQFAYSVWYYSECTDGSKRRVTITGGIVGSRKTIPLQAK